jgi:hypothetical protein
MGVRPAAPRVLGGDVRYGARLGHREDDDLAGHGRPAILPEQPDGEAGKKSGVRLPEHAPPREHCLDDDVSGLARFQGIDPERTGQRLVKKKERLRRAGAELVREPHAEERRPRGHRFGERRDLAPHAPDVAPGQHPGDRHAGEQRGEDQVETVVAGVGRGDRHDEAHQDVPQPEVRDPDAPVGDETSHGDERREAVGGRRRR